MSVSTTVRCVVCEAVQGTQTGHIPEGWGKFWDESLICDHCIESWRKRFGEEPPVYDKGVKR